MAQVTALSPLGAPGLPYAFVAKTPAAVVYDFLVGALKYVAAQMPGTFYFEAFYRATTGTVYARLYDLTASAEVAGSVLSTALTTFQLQQTDALTLIDGHVYEGQFGNEGADAGEARVATVIRVTS
jgi:hypothetical protein